MSTYEESFTINPPIFKIKNEFDKPNNQINGIVIDKTVTQALNLKQDKMKGKSLSANDYTNEDKNKLYFVSDNFPILVNTVSSKVDNVEFNEYKNETINILDNKVNKDGNKVLSTHDFTTILKTKLEGLYNYDDTILATKLNQLENSLNTILKDENATAVIDTFQEIENFLQGITNTKTLTGLLQDLKSDIVTLCSNTYIAKPANGKSSQFLKGDGSVDNNVYLTGINKSQVEGVLTGNITSHTHSQYLTSHQSLTNYVDRSNAQEISGIKTFINDVNMGGTGSTGNKITWARNTDYAHIFFKNDSDADGDSYLGFQTGDNGNEYFRFSHISGGKESVWATIKSGGITSGSFIKSGGTSSQFLKGDGSVDNNVYLTGINKSQVENVLTGNITSHTHSQYLTSHQSLANYVTLNGKQTISGDKTFTGTNITIQKPKDSWAYLRINSGDNYWDIAQTNNNNLQLLSQDALEFRKNGGTIGMFLRYTGSSYGKLGIVSETAESSIGYYRNHTTTDKAEYPSWTAGVGIGTGDSFGWWYSNIGCKAYLKSDGSFNAGSFVKTGGTSSQFLKADGSVDSNSYLTTGNASNTYVKKVGDTITGDLHIRKNDTYTNNYNDGIRLHVGGSSKCAGILLCGEDNTGDVGTSANSWGLFTHEGKFGIGRNGTGLDSGTARLWCDTSNIWYVNGSNKLWHAGNDGSGSGLDADTVDGYHSTSLWRSDGATWNPSANISLNASANNQEWSFDITRNGKTGCYWHVWDSALQTLLKVNADDGKVSAPYGFVGSLTGNASSASTASQLSNSRTLWGQSFNGTANVSGTLNGVGRLEFNDIGNSPSASYRAYMHQWNGSIGICRANTSWTWIDDLFYINMANKSSTFYGNLSTKGQLTLDGNSSYNSFNEGLRINSTFTNPLIHFGGTGESGTGENQWSLGIHNKQYFALTHNAWSNTILSSLPNGNVGIGTSSPTYKLHVNGAIKSSNLTTDSITLTSNKKILIEGDVYKTWLGTEAQFNAIATKDANTIYYIKE